MTTTQAHFVDQHVGVRIRARRRELGISQEQLAEAVGCTFQQIQKYENAKNRVASSRLFAIAQTLKVAPRYFFDGLPAPSATGEPIRIPSPWATDAAEAAMLLSRLKSPTQRRRILELARAIAEDSETV